MMLKKKIQMIFRNIFASDCCVTQISLCLWTMSYSEFQSFGSLVCAKLTFKDRFLFAFCSSTMRLIDAASDVSAVAWFAKLCIFRSYLS